MFTDVFLLSRSIRLSRLGSLGPLRPFWKSVVVWKLLLGDFFCQESEAYANWILSLHLRTCEPFEPLIEAFWQWFSYRCSHPALSPLRTSRPNLLCKWTPQPEGENTTGVLDSTIAMMQLRRLLFSPSPWFMITDRLGLSPQSTAANT